MALDRQLQRMAAGVQMERWMTDKPTSTPDFARPLIDAVSLFTALRIDYALVGGLAAMHYGRARFTDDLDFVVSPNHQTVLADNPAVMTSHRFDPSCTYMLYHESGVDIDLWKDEHVADIVGRAVSAEVGGRAIQVAELHDLIAMKLRAGRLQDDYDIGEMVKRNSVDHPYLNQLILPEEYERFKAIGERIKRQNDSGY